MSYRAVEESAAGAGLVSVSTTCRELPTALAWAENVITVDPKATRITRMRKGVGVAAKSLHNMGGYKQTKWLVTLTYAGDNRAWRAEQISRFLDCLRKWHYARTGSKKVRYAWVAELQQRGVIHYHVVVWLDQGLTLPKPDKQGWWPHGMSNRKQATAPVAYLMKYVSKVDTKNVGGFPRGSRIYGIGGLDQTGRDIKRWIHWPAYVQGNAACGERFRPAKGGGYLNVDDGRIFLAEFAPTGGGFKSFIRIRTHARELEPVGPFSWSPGYVAWRAGEEGGIAG